MATDKLATANKLDKYLKESGYDMLKAVSDELRALGSYEAAAESAKRDLTLTQSKRDQLISEMTATQTKLEAMLQTLAAERERAEGDIARRRDEADAYAAAQRANGDKALLAAQQTAAKLRADAEIDAEAHKFDKENELQKTLAAIEQAHATLDGTNTVIAKQQAKLDQINSILAGFSAKATGVAPNAESG